MATYYAKKALQVLCEEGPVEFTKQSKDFLLWGKILSKNRRFRVRTLKNYYESKAIFDAPADPHKLIWVNPKQIKYYNNSICKVCGLGQIESGEWDKDKSLWKETWRYRGLKERFVDGLAWEDTVYLDHYEKKLDRTGRASGCTSLEEFLDVRCRYLDELYQELQENGYAVDNSKRVKKETRVTWKDPYEPFASITRSGEIHVNEGNHRRALAEFAGIEKIPLNVLVRHKQWQALRDEVYNNGLPESREDLRDHPDLQEILSL